MNRFIVLLALSGFCLKTQGESDTSSNRSIENETVWSNINEEVDAIMPLILNCMLDLNINHLNLPDVNDEVLPILIPRTSLTLTNGIVYNIGRIQRYDNAYMTYHNKSFVAHFSLIIDVLQFDYNYLISAIGIRNTGKVLGSLKDTVIFGSVTVSIATAKITVHNFKIVRFRQMYIELDQPQFLRNISAFILNPVTAFFENEIKAITSDGLKAEMQVIFDEFTQRDCLNLKQFSKSILKGLIV